MIGIFGNKDENIVHVYKNCISISVATVLEVSKMTVPICTSVFGSASHLCHVTCSVFSPCWQWQEWTRPTLSLIGLPWGRVSYFLYDAKRTKNTLVSFDRTDKTKVSFESAKGPLLFLYSHNNNEIMCFSKINKINRCVLCRSSVSVTFLHRHVNKTTWISAKTRLKYMRHICIESLNICF